MEKRNKFGEFVRDLRARRGLTQGRLAAELGVSYPTVSRWERGKSRPNSSAAFAILNQYMNRVGAEHPDLLVRFHSEVSVRGAGTPSIPEGSFTSNSHFIVFQFLDHQGKQQDDSSADLLRCVKSTAQGLQELLQKAQSGDEDASEKIRLTCEWVNTPGQVGHLKALAHAIRLAAKRAAKSKRAD